MILYLMGWVFNIVSACLLLPIAVGMFYGEVQWKYYLAVALVSLAAGLILSHKKPKRNVFYAKEGFVTVAMTWIILSLVGAVPFYVTGEIPSYVDAVFETASGFSTTGASILTNVEALSRTALFWRSFTHWIGGMGVLVFLIAIVPLTGGHTMQLMKAESPGPSVGKIVPKVRQTAFILYAIYTALTVLEGVLLGLGGMPIFDSVTTALATAGTGGFAIRGASMAFYQSYYLQGVVTVFMILFGVNFNVYYLLLLKKFKDAFKNEEFLWYTGIIAFSVLCITLNIRNAVYAGNTFEAFHHTAFSVASVISTTGFATADFVLWPHFSQMILIMIMFCGACAGSTGGGMKCSRVLILLRSIRREVHHIIHPRSVEVIKLDGKVVEEDTVHSIMIFIGAYLLVIMSAGLIISLNGVSFPVSFSSALTCVSNVGPGLDVVGPSGNFAAFSGLSKLVMSLTMIVGRLDIFPVLVLFSRSTWRRT